MDHRIKELIAVGASIAANCQPCLEYHVAKARENGADDRDIAQAVAVGRTVRKGAAGKMDQYAATVLKDTPAAGDDEPKACGCKLT